MAANRDTKIIGYLPELVANPLARRGIRTVGELVDLPWETILHRTPGFGSLRAGLLLQFMEDEGLVVRPTQSGLDQAVIETVDGRWRESWDYRWRSSGSPHRFSVKEAS